MRRRQIPKHQGFVLVLPNGRALANAGSASLASLAKETFVLCHRGFSPTMYDSIVAACARAGFSPKIGQEAPQIVTVIPLVAAGFGVSIVPRSFSEIHLPGVAYIDIEDDAPRSSIVLAWRRDERSAAVKNAMKVARLAKLAT
jgi:DNA-binding transcriptional LysR family regulator